MRRLCLLLPAILSFAFASTALALVIAPPPGGVRAALADGIILGTVVAHEPKDIMLSPFPGAEEKTPHRIAVVKVTEVLKGVAKDKTVRIAFALPGKDEPITPRPKLKIDAGTEGLFYLTRHHQDKELFTTPAYFDVVPRDKNPNFDKEVKSIRAGLKLLEDPLASLKSKNADDRKQITAMLIHKYREQRTPEAKTEAIPAEESKLILKNLREADWKREGEFGTGPFELFMRLGLTQKDGWKDMDNVEIEAIKRAAQEWLTKNADTYRIKRFVAK